MTPDEARSLGNGADFSELVESTRGLQPWRRIFHATNGVLLAWLPWQLGMTIEQVLLVLGVFFVLFVAVDLVRLRAPSFNTFFFRVFQPLVSPREAEGLTSSVWYTLGAFLSYALFPVHVAIPAILVLGLADPAASFVGRSVGRRTIGKGTWAGAFAFFAVSCVILVAAGFGWRGVLAALLTTAAELTPVGPDDNLWIPLAAGGVLVLLA